MIVGGSYPGAMVAWFKNRYPDHVMAVWASSGVINAIQDYHHYDMDVYLST
jgi:dipeptidyl aminopeptidase/acylaminoacyl peptidase